MRITKDTSIQELQKASILEKGLYLHLIGKGYDNVGKLLLAKSKYHTLDTPQKREVGEFILFLEGITEFLSEYEKGQKTSQIATCLPHCLLFTLKTIYQNEKRRFKAESILEVVLSDKSEFFYEDLLYTLFVNPNKILEEEFPTSQLGISQQDSGKTDVRVEQYLYAINTIISNLINALEYFPDCIYYKKLLKLSNYNPKYAENAEDFIKSNFIRHISNVIDDSTQHESYDEFQRKYEELQSNFCVRTRNVIKYNIPSYLDSLPWVLGEKKEFRFRHCGKRTIIDIKEFLILFKEFYLGEGKNEKVKYDLRTSQEIAHYLELDEESLFNKSDAFKIIKHIFPRWDNFVSESPSVDEIYAKLYDYNPRCVLDCFIYLANLFYNPHNIQSKQSAPSSFVSYFLCQYNNINDFIKKNRIELEYQKYITDEKEKMIQNLFNQLVSETSVKCQNATAHFISNYKGFLSYLGKEQYFYNIPQVGRRTAEELKRLLNTFYIEYKSILMSEEAHSKEGNIKFEFPFLDDDSTRFVCDFREKYNRFPMFYILIRYFKTATDFRAQVYASYCKLSENGFSLEKEAEKYGLSKERIRQIINGKEFRTDKKFKNLKKPEHWKSYHMHIDNYESYDNSPYLSLCREEQISISFLSYCKLLSIFSKSFEFNISDSGKILSGNDVINYQNENKHLNTYLCNYHYHSFLFGKALREANRLILLKREKSQEISILKQFIKNKIYWQNEVLVGNRNFHEGLMQFFEMLITTYIKDDCINNHFLILRANTTNYKDIIYNILKENGEKMHLNAIFTKFKEQYPDHKYDNPRYLKHYLIEDDRIEFIGKSSYWKLVEWDGFSGTLFQLATEIVSQSQKPVSYWRLSSKMLKYRSDSTEKSISSVISQMVNEGKLILYHGNLVGLPGAKYDIKYIKMPQSFDEWLGSFKSFSLEHNCFPIRGTGGYEGSLARWHWKTSQLDNLSSEERSKYRQVMNELSEIPHTKIEQKFLEKCNQYRAFVKETGSLVSYSDDSKLNHWFSFNSRCYQNYEDNRRLYFKKLIAFLVGKTIS